MNFFCIFLSNFCKNLLSYHLRKSIMNYKLKNRMLTKIFTTIFVIFFYRICLQIPTAGVDYNLLINHQKTSDSLFGFITNLTGSEAISIFSLGISPYIFTSILSQLLFLSFDSLKKYKEQHSFLINQLTRLASLIVSFWFAKNILYYTESEIDKYTAIISIVCGSTIAMWMSEKISEQKLGNGTSIIIFSTIVGRLPLVFGSLYNKVETGIIPSYTAILEICYFILCIIFVIYCESAIKRIYVMHSSQQNQMSKENFIPIKLNPAGILPIIFTQMLFAKGILPVIHYLSSNISYLESLAFYISPGKIYYMLIEILLLAYITYTFSSVIFEGKVIAENLQKQNTYIKGIKPGKNTENYLNFIINNMNVVSIIYISLICIIIPTILLPNLSENYYLGGTSILILVSVVIETFTQIQNQQINIQYSKIRQKVKFIR